MTAITWTAKAFRYEQRSFWRTPGAPIFSFAMPVMMLVIFGALNSDGHIGALGGIPFSRYMTVGLIAFTMATTAYGSLTARVTYRREMGIYQRLRTTPLPAPMMIAGQLLNTVSVIALTVALLLVVGVGLYDAVLPTDWPLFVLVLLVSSATFCAIGLAVGTFVRSAESIDPIIWATVMPVTFISGSFEYVSPHSVLGRISELFPVRHTLLATLHAFGLPGDSGNLWQHLAVLTAWGIGAGVVAVKRFRWAPSR